ncbi:MAG: TRAP transporter substrate-binding protein DctP [Gammaproteobacteria bacterium]|nr:TRAP transporter substrate-binding protein DctP [Gammaproteobacteria bacterium]MCY4340539.1 TRAP transporter substrate-binding protein DctP [Gammaproteobacteria bacterium]
MNTSDLLVKRCGLALLSALLLSAPCGAQTLKIATVAPEGSSWMRDMRAAAAEIGERTGGQVQVKFYGGGTQGDDLRVLRKIRGRQLQGAVLTSSALAGVYPEMLQYGLPLLFRSREEMLFVRSRIDSMIADGLRAKGFESFGFASLGFARIMSTENPVVRLEDARGLKIWVPKGDDIGFSAMRLVGLAPLELPISDVLVSLQTGIVDVVVGPPSGAILLQWHTRIRYVTDFPLVFAYGLLAIDRRAFERLSAGNQSIVRQAFTRLATDLDRRDAEENAAASQALRNAGLEYLQPPPEEVERWRQAFSGSYPELVREADMSAELHQRIMALLAEFRAAQGAG